MSDNMDTPTNRKSRNQANGGVAIAARSGNNQAPNPERPGWVGPAPDSSKSSFSAQQPFGEHKQSLSGSATSFHPVKDGSQKPTPISMLTRGSSVDNGDDVYPVIVSSSAVASAPATNGVDVQKKTSAGAIGSGSRQPSPKSKDTFTTDTGPGVTFKGAHYVKIERIQLQAFDEDYKVFSNEYGWDDKIISQHCPDVASSQPGKYITLFICFDDVADAAQAFSDLEVVPAAQNWVPSYISQTEYAAKLAYDSEIKTSFFDGQVMFHVTFKGVVTELDVSVVPAEVRRFAQEFGDILAFEVIFLHTDVECRVEYAKISSAREVLGLVTTAQPMHIDEWEVTSYALQSYQVPYTKPPGTPKKAIASGREVFCSPTGRTSWSFGQDGETIIEMPMKTIPKVSGAMEPSAFTPGPRGRWQSEPVPHTPVAFDGSQFGARSVSWTPGDVAVHRDTEPQCVSTDRIASGQDVRTTIMLRNLPNRWTAVDLKKAIDKVVAGKYDFSYLRIDFEWNTNVGYAFVNFTDPAHVIPFVEAYVGQEWAPGSFPRKTAAVSYATVQGYDCLVEKFRNSAIMDEYPGFRPKLWYTEETAPEPAMVGEEKSFPPPNNFSKKQRSHDNAGTIGLWAPRNGQHRQSASARRSQYDRGTTRQIQEDAAFNMFSPGYVADGAHGAVGGPPMFALPWGGYGGGYPPFAPPMHFGEGYGYPGPYFHPPGYPVPGQTINPASKLRTISKGRLAGRPQNVGQHHSSPAFYGGPVQYPAVPRSFSGEQDPRVVGYGNDARQYNNGAPHYPQY